MLAQALTLITQVFITTQLIKRLGVGWTLAILPLVTLAESAGDVLAFLPGVAEIRRTADLLEPLAGADLKVLTLYGDLPAEPRVASPVDDAHATLAELRQDLVVLELGRRVHGPSLSIQASLDFDRSASIRAGRVQPCAFLPRPSGLPFCWRVDAETGSVWDFGGTAISGPLVGAER